MKVARDLSPWTRGSRPFVFPFPPGGRARITGSSALRAGKKTKGSLGACLPGTEVPGKIRPPSGRKSRNPMRPSPSAPRAVKAIDVFTPSAAADAWGSDRPLHACRGSDFGVSALPGVDRWRGGRDSRTRVQLTHTMTADGRAAGGDTTDGAGDHAPSAWTPALQWWGCIPRSVAIALASGMGKRGEGGAKLARAPQRAE